MDKKKYLPVGITEAKLVEIVDKVCTGPCYKFIWGFNDIDDMRQHSYMLAIKFLTEGKFKPRGEKPMDVQLTNFLRVWIYNRLSNYRRDNCCRYPNTGGVNQTKFNLQYALPIYSMDLAESEIFARENTISDEIDLKDTINKITSKLSKAMLRRYNSYLAGEKLDAAEEAKLFKRIRRILGEDYQI